MNRTVLRALLRHHEGVRLKPYADTAGHWTIGVGRCLDTTGISEAEAELLLDDDISRVLAGLTARVPCFGSLPQAQQHALVDIAFNVGIEGLLKFTRMLAAIEARDFEKATEEMLASRWAKQVGNRATELAVMMREGSG